jgi:hypothetical protein
MKRYTLIERGPCLFYLSEPLRRGETDGAVVLAYRQPLPESALPTLAKLRRGQSASMYVLREMMRK